MRFHQIQTNELFIVAFHLFRIWNKLCAKNNHNKQKASNLWNQKMCLWNPFGDVSSKVNDDTFKLSIFTSGMSGNLLQSLRADEAILALLTLFQSGKQEGKYSIQCYLPVVVAFTVISFAAVFLCRSHLRENGTDRKRLQRWLPSRLFSLFGVGAVTQRAPSLPQRCVTSQKASEK